MGQLRLGEKQLWSIFWTRMDNHGQTNSSTIVMISRGSICKAIWLKLKLVRHLVSPVCIQMSCLLPPETNGFVMLCGSFWLALKLSKLIPETRSSQIIPSQICRSSLLGDRLNQGMACACAAGSLDLLPADVSYVAQYRHILAEMNKKH